MASLAHIRELSALADTARAVARRQGKKRAQALQTAADALEAERAVSPRVDIESARAGIRDLLALAQVWPEPSARQIRKGAKRITEKARAAFEDGNGAKTERVRHEWRKREKDRFYAATILDGAWPDKRRAKLAEKLGDALGKERDAILLIERLEASPQLVGERGKALDRVRVALKERAGLMRQRANKLGRELHAHDA